MSLGGDGAVHCDDVVLQFSYSLCSIRCENLPSLSLEFEVQRYTGFVFKMADFRKSAAFRSYGVKECLILVVISSGLYVASIRFLPLSPNTNWRSSIH